MTPEELALLEKKIHAENRQLAIALSHEADILNNEKEVKE